MSIMAFLVGCNAAELNGLLQDVDLGQLPIVSQPGGSASDDILDLPPTPEFNDDSGGGLLLDEPPLPPSSNPGGGVDGLLPANPPSPGVVVNPPPEVVVDPQIAQGKQNFAVRCQSCHGPNGAGAAVVPRALRAGVCLRVDCGNLAALTNYITQSMPPNNVGACVGACSEGIAKNIVAAFARSTELSTLSEQSLVLKILSNFIHSSHVEVIEQDSGRKIFESTVVEEGYK